MFNFNPMGDVDYTQWNTFFEQVNNGMTKYRSVWLHSWAVWHQTNLLVMQKYIEATNAFFNAISTQHNFMAQTLQQMMKYPTA